MPLKYFCALKTTAVTNYVVLLLLIASITCKKIWQVKCAIVRERTHLFQSACPLMTPQGGARSQI